MFVRLWKEMRQLGPTFLVVNLILLALGLFSHFTIENPNHEAYLLFSAWGLWVVFVIGVSLLSVLLYGNEFSFNTLDFLLAQGISRKRIWTEKILALWVLLTATYVSFSIGIWIIDDRAEFVPRLSANMDELVWAGFIGGPLLIFAVSAAAPLLTLYLRQTHTAFWLFVFSPALIYIGALVIYVFLAILGLRISIEFTHFPGPLILVFLSGFALFRWSFRRFEGLEIRPGISGSETISKEWVIFPKVSMDTLLPNSAGCSLWLFAKEMRLQRVGFVIATLMVFAWGVSYAMVKVVLPDAIWEESGFINSIPELAIVLKVISVNALLFALPMIFGCDAFAQERNLGVEPWALSQPKSRLSQWSIKFEAAMIPALVGAIVATIMSDTWNHMVLSPQATGLDDGLRAVMGPHEWNLWTPLLLFSICFYTSSFARGSIQAFLYALGIFVATVYMVTVGRYSLHSIDIPLRAIEGLLDYPGFGFLFPVCLLFLLFSYSNFRARQDFTSSHFVPQVVAWVIAIGCFSMA
ncbi:MAG: hypothetical protein H6751_07075 [Candidatus Omnitrophica bacterium]|nr:hypothetical protein [Candidatus Omnitrophota bacterium]